MNSQKHSGLWREYHNKLHIWAELGQENLWQAEVTLAGISLVPRKNPKSNEVYYFKNRIEVTGNMRLFYINCVRRMLLLLCLLLTALAVYLILGLTKPAKTAVVEVFELPEILTAEDDTQAKALVEILPEGVKLNFGEKTYEVKLPKKDHK